MANPENTGTFEQQITATLDFEEIHPKSGSTGDFEAQLTATLDFETYVEIAAPPTIRRIFITHT